MISDTATLQTPDMSAATSNAKAIEGASTNSTTVNGAGTLFSKLGDFTLPSDHCIDQLMKFQGAPTQSL